MGMMKREKKPKLYVNEKAKKFQDLKMKNEMFRSPLWSPISDSISSFLISHASTHFSVHYRSVFQIFRCSVILETLTNTVQIYWFLDWSKSVGDTKIQQLR